MIPFGMIASLIDTVREIAVPAEFARADLRVVIGDADARFQLFKMHVARIIQGFAGPPAAAVWVRQGVQQIVLIFPRQVTKRRFVAPNAFAIQIAQIVQERFLIFVRVRGQHEVDVAIHQSFLRARSVRGGDNQIAEHDQRFILVLIEEKRLPSWRGEVFRGVHTALRWRQLRPLRRFLRRSTLRRRPRRPQRCRSPGKNTST